MGFLDGLKKNIKKGSEDKNNTNLDKPTEPPINESTPTANQTSAIRKESIRKKDAKKGLLREENIFSFKEGQKGKESVIEEEQEIYHRVHDVKELDSGTKGELPKPKTLETPKPKSFETPNKIAGDRGALHQLRKMNEASKKDTIDVTEWKQQKPVDASTENLDNPTLGLRTTPKANEQSINFSWENNSIIEPPKEGDFAAREMQSIAPVSEEEKRTELDSFGWEKKNIIDKPKAEDFVTKSEIEKGTPSVGWRNNDKEPDWLAEDKIVKDTQQSDAPTAEDFAKMEEDNKKDEKKKSKSKDKKKSVTKKDSKETKDKSASWLDALEEEKFEVPEGMEQGPKRIEEDVGKEITEKGQVGWLEGDVEENTLQDDVLEDMKKSVGPKWKTGKKVSVKEKKPEEQRLPEALSTPIDKMFDLLSSYKEANAVEIAQFAGLSVDEIEIIARKFEEEGIVEMHYYTTPGKRPSIKFKEDVPSTMREIPQGTIIDKYEMVVDFVPILVTIVEVKGEPRPIYTLGTPSIGKFTRKFLDIVKDEVAETMPIELDEILDPRKSKKLKVRFFKELTTNLKRYLSSSPPEVLNPLSGIILHELYGLGDIELFMADDMLEEVAINSSKTPLTIYHRIYGWMKTNVFIDSEERIINYASQIGRKVGREITVLKPILDAHLLSGDRVNSTLFPISSEGNTLTIRRFARRPWTIVDFIGKAHTMNTEMAALLWLAMQYELNILVAGGTASGKTSTLNTLLAMVPPYHRLISIEDVREIILPKYLIWNWVPMVTRSPNPEGLGEVTMLELMHSSLRMRPDRIIVGEIRRHREAEVLMEAIETGHSIYSTIHANSGYQVLRRLVEPPMNIPPLQVELIDIVIVQYRDRKTNKRRTYEIAEIEQTSSGQGLQINTIYKWAPRTDSWDKLSKPIKLLTLLNLHTGLTEEDVMKELDDRQMILEWMRDNNITSLDDIGLIMKIFYSDADKVKRFARKNTPIEEFKKNV